MIVYQHPSTSDLYNVINYSDMRMLLSRFHLHSLANVKCYYNLLDEGNVFPSLDSLHLFR